VGRGVIYHIAWDQALHWGKGGKIIGFAEKMGERSEPRDNLGRGKGGDILNV